MCPVIAVLSEDVTAVANKLIRPLTLNPNLQP
jgi:hypothetical protein